MEGNYLILLAILLPIIGGVIGYLIGRRNKTIRNYFAILITLLEVILMIFLYRSLNSYFIWNNFGMTRIYFKIDGFRLTYGIIAAIMWLCTSIFSHEYFKHYRNRNRYYLFTLVTLGATMGVLFSADFITTFIFFEVMSFTSYVMVIHDEKKKSQDAAKTYMAVAVIGGLVMLLGIFMIQYSLGTTDFEMLASAMRNYTGDMRYIYIAGILMMVGFGGKAGMFPIHIWLPNSHPSAPAPASALLSGILTKTGIFGAAIISSSLFLHDGIWGRGVLIIGVITMFVGAFLAIFSIDLKRILAYSSVSQIGFIVVGLGMQGILGDHNAIAVRGTILHMVNHSLIKLVLFMAAGVIYMNIHDLDLNKIRGYGRHKPLLLLIFAMGVLSIMGVPLWSGYISKTLLHECILEEIMMAQNYPRALTFFRSVEWLFTISGGFTTAYMLKIFIAIFIEKNNYRQQEFDLRTKYMSKLSSLALLIPAIILPTLGVFPNIMDRIGGFGQEFFYGTNPAHEVHYFIWVNERGALISVFIGVLIYILIRRFLMVKDEEGKSYYINPWPKYLDIEEYIYKPVLQELLPRVGEFFAGIIGNMTYNIGFMGYRLFRLFESIYYGINKALKSRIKGIETILHKDTTETLSMGLLEFITGVVFILVVWVLIR